MSISGLGLQDLNIKINTIVGVKQYQEVKKAMEAFDNKLRLEMEKPGTQQVDVKIK